MLFIYGDLPMGGIETFILRLFKSRAENKLKSKLLLISTEDRCNKELLGKIRQNAEVVFWDALYSSPRFVNDFFPLFANLKSDRCTDLLEEVEHIHVYEGMHGLIANKLNRLCNRQIPISVGMYHSKKFLWGKNNLPYYEALNRKFLFEYLPGELVYFFSEDVKMLYSKEYSKSFKLGQTFRIGVIDEAKKRCHGTDDSKFSICSVGRLVDFKTYNYLMLDIVKQLLEEGVQVKFDIYGNGPNMNALTNAIQEKGLEQEVKLKGQIEYSKFNDTVSEYDLFIGSGTSIIQASSVGVPSIVGIEHNTEPTTYGYFCDVHKREFNIPDIDIKKVNIKTLIESVATMEPSELEELSLKHVECSRIFTNKECMQNFENSSKVKMPSEYFKFNRFYYEFSRVISGIAYRLNKSHPRRFG